MKVQSVKCWDYPHHGYYQISSQENESSQIIPVSMRIMCITGLQDPHESIHMCQNIHAAASTMLYLAYSRARNTWLSRCVSNTNKIYRHFVLTRLNMRSILPFDTVEHTRPPNQCKTISYALYEIYQMVSRGAQMDQQSHVLAWSSFCT